MRRRMKKTRILKVRPYVARLINLNESLSYLPGETWADKIDLT